MPLHGHGRSIRCALVRKEIQGNMGVRCCPTSDGPKSPVSNSMETPRQDVDEAAASLDMRVRTLQDEGWG